MNHTESSSGPRRKAGRPLSFDREAALEQAMLMFWRYGYETTSVTDLTTAMGITAPSLYTAFGDKKQLFLEAAQRYMGDREAIGRAIEAAPTAWDAAHTMLINAVTAYTSDTGPKGCLLASATASGSAGSAEVQLAIANIRKFIAEALGKRLERDIAAGLLPPTTSAPVLAGLVMTILQGMSVLARDGASRASLMAVVDLALQAWPVKH